MALDFRIISIFGQHLSHKMYEVLTVRSLARGFITEIAAVRRLL